MKMDIDITDTIFRAWPNGDVIALFPRIPADNRGNVLSYEHVGQHGAASPDIVHRTKPASPATYDALLRELRGRGYNVRPITRFPRQRA